MTLLWTAIIIYLICLGFMVLFSISQLDLTRRFLSLPADEAIPSSGDRLPMVTIQLPMYNERFVAGRLLEAVAHMDWPKDRLEVQVLDDSSDDTTLIVREHVERMRKSGLEVNVITRDSRTGFKAGALAEGLEKAAGEFTAIFDADFIPAPDFLRKTIPSFQAERLGAVQARWGHLNSGKNLLTSLQALGLDAHFTVEQAGRSGSGCFMNFNGTCGVWRTACIRDAGGWSADTLTEDLDLSYRAQLRGWRIRYLRDIAVPGELPEHMAALKAQQYRWTKGGAETARLLLGKVIMSPLPLLKKFHAVMHLCASAIFPAILISGSASLIIVWSPVLSPELSRLIQLGAFGFIGFLSVSCFYLISIARNRDNRLWHLPLFLVVSMGLSWHNAVAVIAGWRGRRTPFVRTPKLSSAGRERQKIAGSTYRSVIGEGYWMELLLAVVFGAAVVHGLSTGRTGFLVFHGMMCAGFTAVGAYSAIELLRRNR